MEDSVTDRLARYDGTWWWVEEVSENRMAKIWSNGQPAIVPVNQLEFYKDGKSKGVQGK